MKKEEVRKTLVFMLSLIIPNRGPVTRKTSKGIVLKHFKSIFLEGEEKKSTLKVVQTKLIIL